MTPQPPQQIFRELCNDSTSGTAALVQRLILAVAPTEIIQRNCSRTEAHVCEPHSKSTTSNGFLSVHKCAHIHGQAVSPVVQNAQVVRRLLVPVVPDNVRAYEYRAT